MSDRTPVFTGAHCLPMTDSKMVIEIRKREKWEMHSDKPPTISLGCIGGAIESYETPIQTIHREAFEEINCQISLYSSHLTADISPSGISIHTDCFIEDIRPIMVWEVEGNGHLHGSKGAVFVSTIVGDPQPRDLPAIILIDPQLVLTIAAHPLTLHELKSRGAEVRANIDIPSNSRLRLGSALRALCQIAKFDHGLFNTLLSTG
jgi:8-oxo-dGTP pyrophosphatase MutT (NUDIX family)